MSLIHSQKYRPRITWKFPAFLWLWACSGGYLSLWVGNQLSCTSQTFSFLPTLRGGGAVQGTTPWSAGRGSALAGGRGDQGSRGGEKGQRACRGLRNRKHLFALEVCEKKKQIFSSTSRQFLLPPSPRRVAFPSSAFAVSPSAPLPSCWGPPGAGRELGDQLAQHLCPAAHRALACTRAGCWSTRVPGHGALGAARPCRSWEHSWATKTPGQGGQTGNEHQERGGKSQSGVCPTPKQPFGG